MSHRNPVITISIGLALILYVFPALSGPLNDERKAELKHLLLHDCGSCHGMTLKGGLGPALTADVLAGKPRLYLQQTIRDGHPGTPMPPWRGILTQEEINYLVELLTTEAGRS